MSQTLKSLEQSIREFSQMFAQFTQNALPYLRTLVENVRVFPDFAEKMFSVFHRRSWYLIPQVEASIIFPISKLISEERLTEIDDLMSEIVTRHLAEIENDICELHPDREHLIREGFQNHRDKRYASAILLFFSQIDGISMEILEVGFFNKENKIPKSAKKIKAILGKAKTGETPLEEYERRLSYSLLTPMLDQGGVNYNESERADFPDGVNRHSILHGTKSDYGTEINSLKVISLLSYLTGIARETIDDARQRLNNTELHIKKT